MCAHQYRQPRLAEIVADELRREILSGKLADGDYLPRQEILLDRFHVSPPSMREAFRILETEGLITVQRGNVGGAVVHVPAPEGAAYTAALVLESNATELRDVAEALLNVEPVCAALCAGRKDRRSTVVPELEASVSAQRSNIDDLSAFNRATREFHEAISRGCGNKTMVLLVGALEALWSAHEADWAHRTEIGGKHVKLETVRAGLRDHEKIMRAIAEGNADKASRLARAHLEASQSYTLSGNRRRKVDSSLLR